MDNPRLKVLAIDDEQSSLNAIYRTLRREFDVILSLNGQSGIEVLKTQEIAVILGDQRMPQMTGVEFFKKSMAYQPNSVRILVTGYTDIEATIQAINDGQIFYYINKPWEPEDLRIIVRRAVTQYLLVKENQRLLKELEAANQRLKTENVILHKEMEKQFAFENIIGQSPALKKVFDLMRKVIPTETTVLIIGETGTGKELIAKAIHYNGTRNKNLFLAQNCAALPDTLLESELFGHQKGAFTGASSDKKGLFELADKGTIFLDEIGDTSPALQQRLLRVLQEGEIFPLGSEKMKKVDVRIIAASNQDLEAIIHSGKFREDLYYRLNVFPIRVPPLRERREDIPLLAKYFLEKYSRKTGKQISGISIETISLLMNMDFPGNIRELENLIERSVTLAEEGGILIPDLMGLDLSILNKTPFPFSQDHSGTLKEKTEAVEKFYIDQTLTKFKGNISKTARDLGLSRLGLHKKLQRYQIEASNYKQN
jgi:two-component system response regulator HupR/HoxA